jgi:two-component system, OmpR family, alkaline phosphatase synthesis response regulator PhoP
MRVMLVDDEPSFHVLVQSVCESAGHEFLGVTDSMQTIDTFRAFAPDVALLDIMMPGMDGYQVCEALRQADPDVAVIFLSAKSTVPDKREAFARGADDYLVKPFEGEELLMRLEALRRRRQRAVSPAAPAASENLRAGAFEFDPVRQQLMLEGAAVQLTPKEFQILYTLALKPDTVMSKEELIEAVWGREYLNDSISIAVYVRKIREKIEPNPAKPRYLKTAWGMGYSFSVR